MRNRLLRSFVFSAITICIIAGGYAAERPLPDGKNNPEEGLATDISASLVVCGQGARLISSFGHCSIHMSCPSANLDNYYTYLILASPANIKRFFTEGLCTGHFEAQKWDQFSKDYVEQNRPITEYRLNLTIDEVRRLWLNLDKETYNPESRDYSFLHSQCTSIIADIIRKSLINERIEYGSLPKPLQGTLRDYTDYTVAGHPWYLFCFQSLLGAEGEQSGTIWEKLAPTVIYPVWSQSVIVDAAGNRRPVFTGDTQALFSPQTTTLNSHPSKLSTLNSQPSNPLKPSQLSTLNSQLSTPTLLFSLFLVITLLLTFLERRVARTRPSAKRGWWRLFDAILLIVQTILGLFFTWLLLFSKASWMPGNLLPIVFNPIPALLWLLFHKKKGFRRVYILYAVVLTAMIIATPFVPQLQWGHALIFAIFLIRVLNRLLNNNKLPNYSKS